MTPQELKNSILQLAIQGKLVEQREEEGTAEELYQQIQEEKKRLIKEGKIKKEKSLPKITEDEVPFEIPDSWKWVRWGELVNIVSSRRVHQSDWKNEGIPFYRAREIAKLAISGVVENELYISKELYEEFSKFGVPHKGDLMVTAVGTLGKTYVVKESDQFYYKDASVICLENFSNLYSEYLKYVMCSELMEKQIKSNSGGTTVATLTMVRMMVYLFPLPPLAEQKRIVAKIEELLPYIERYEQAWNKLQNFNKCFPIDMQKSILQMAIQGKLVEQRPEEGTGEELYQQVQVEKQRLIKEGKRKKEQSLPEIGEEEKPFDIPESWKWVRLNEIVSKEIKRGKSPTYTTHSNTIVFAQKCNTKLGKIDLSLALCLDESKLEKYPSSEFMLDCDIVINSTGNGTLGRVGIYQNSDNFNGQLIVPDSHVTVIRVSCLVCVWYIFYCLKYYQPYMEKLGSGSTNQTELGASKIKELLIPLPSLAEQQRIVVRLKELLPLCEKLK